MNTANLSAFSHQLSPKLYRVFLGRNIVPVFIYIAPMDRDFINFIYIRKLF